MYCGGTFHFVSILGKSGCRKIQLFHCVSLVVHFIEENIDNSFEEIDKDNTRREKVEKIWNQFDENRDGVLDKEEAYRFLRVSLKEFSGQESKNEKAFKLMDADHNGKITKSVS